MNDISSKRDRHDEGQPAVGALLAFVFPRPVEVIALGQVHFLPDLFNCLAHRAAQVAAAHAVLDGDIARIPFAIDGRRAIIQSDLAHLPSETRSPDGARIRMLAISSTVLRNCCW